MQTTTPPQATLEESFIVDLWHRVHGQAAAAQGWSIFDCSGSKNGRWQINRIDDPDGSCVLSDDTEAWSIVMGGQLDEHECARALIMRLNPAEWTDMCLTVGLQAERFDFKVRTYAVLPHASDGAGTATDDAELWVQSPSAALVRLAIANTGASFHDTMDGDEDIDFVLPEQLTALRESLGSVDSAVGRLPEEHDMPASAALVAFVQVLRSAAALFNSESVLARTLGNPLPDDYRTRCKSMFYSTYAGAAKALGLPLDDDTLRAIIGLPLPEAVIHTPAMHLPQRWIFNYRNGWRLAGVANGQ